MTARLRHAAHPLQFGAIQVIGTRYLCPAVVDTLLPFLQIVAVVATIGVHGLVVELQDHRAHTVQEETVVGHHQQGFVATVQIALQPLNHLEVQVVGRLIEYQQVGIGNEHVCQRHTLLLSAAQLPHGLLQVAYLQLCEHLLGLQHLLGVALVVETGIEHALVGVKVGCLFQHAHTQVTTEDDVTLVIALFARQDRQQGALTRTVLGYQTYLLPLGYRKTQIAKQHQRAKRLGEVLYVQVWIFLSHSLQFLVD